MPAPLVRRCLTAGGLTLALVLSAPLAALAAPGDAPSGGGPERGGRPTTAPASADAQRADGTQERSAEDGAQGGRAEGGSQSGPADSSGSSSSTPQGGSAQRPAANGAGGAARPQGRPDSGRPAGPGGGGDPRGDNGTVKVDGVPFDDSRGDEPHVGCDVRLVFWGFDAGDRATITFTGHAPTGGGLLHRETATISDDAAGGGQDRDAALVYSVHDGGALSELLAVTPHPQRGWHVKVAADVLGAPGGAKQKVFWMSCPTADGTTAAPAGGDARPPGTGVLGSAGTRTDVAGTTQQAATADTVVATRSAGGGTGLALGGAGVASDAATAGAAAAPAVGGRLAGQAGVGPQALPFTGPQALGALVSLGVGSLLAGGAAHHLGRRRTATA